MRSVKLSIGVLLLLSLSLTAINMLSSVGAQQGDISPAISAAQNKLVQCYDAARAAESSGANISQLTIRLNSAGLLLSQAELAYFDADFGSAMNLAAQSQNELSDFVSDVQSLQASAAQSQTFDFLLNVVASVVGTILVIVGGFIVWIRLKRKYGNNKEQKSESNPI